MVQKVQSRRFSRGKSSIVGLLSLSLSFPGQATSEDQQAQKLAEITTQWDQLAQSQSPGEAVKTMAAQQLSSAVTSTLTPWFNQYGNARLTLPFDSHFSLKDVSFDWLLPWYNVASGTAFSQLGVKTHHGQTTTVVGFGYRYQADNWLWGANAFWDALWPGQHHRYGLGLEAWHDNVKLSANLYQRLSHWKTARLTDFDARPANGWDIQAEAYLPAFPHWGGQLQFEQYYGQQVALFGESERQKNPYSVTAGLTYTPVPLVTLGADFRQGKQGTSENRFTLNLNYRLDVPFSQQLDPNAVAPLRSLRSSQFDFVNRRSDIVLDYQKQTLLTLAFPASINGYEGKKVTFAPVIHAKYPLARLELDTSELQQAGGKVLDQQPEKVTLRLPKTTEKPVRLSGIAIDSRGHRSNRAEIMVVSLSTEKQLQVTANKTQAKADGHDSVIYTVLVTDQEGTPVPNQAVIWASDKGELSQTRQNTDAQGQTSVVLCSRQRGLHRVRVSVDGEVAVAPLVQFNVVLIPTITIDKHSVKADGKAQAMLTVTVQNAAGEPVPDQAVGWQTSLGQFSSFSLTTDPKGQATAYLTSRVSGAAEVTVAAGSETRMSSPITFTASLTHTLQMDKQTAIADGQDSILYAVNVRDAADQPVANSEVHWSVDNGQLPDKQEQTNSQGEATARLVSRVAGTATVNVDVSGKTLHASPVTFKRLLKPAITVDKARAKGDGQDTVVLTATVKDSLGLPVENQPMVWQTDHGVLSSERTQTDNQGQTQVQLSSTFAGLHQVQIQVGDNKVAAPIVTFDEVLLSTIRVNKTRAAANGTEQVTFTVTVMDSHGRGVPDKAVDWSGEIGEMILVENRTDNRGSVTATFVGRHPGQGVVIAQIGEQQLESPVVEFVEPLRIVDTVAVDSQGGNANQKSFGLRGPSVFWRGAKFRIITAGNTGRVNWRSDSSSVTVSVDRVTVQQRPDGVRLTGTDEAGQQVILTLTDYTWFERSGLTKDFYSNAKQLCKSLGSRIASKYALEQLYEEWGNFYLYDGWAREFYVTSTDYLAASSGSAEHQTKWAFWAETDLWVRNAWAMTAFACGR
ncbi:inverse autotransporter beta domain-containing protein [Xenorhabdus nematophila]|uniref:Putative invasin n=3 Tax=Xenorhabdus bovienii TaxID=40576 RepID=A0A077PMP8_XENBV|nr:inverse autotransporter beta domain-containing protein [Xenorhabdus bovienii]MDE9587614.1 inverse autotransporter beta domain-containing protein [Xenorhabdus bovienii]CDH00431.1 putative invasin [Xenorhabdus bovienii str. feltiae Moldova]CDH22343.1 putative invasin [Xenorhabdus bovienii str. kraussei Becker Underwood]